jgi:hypothetical protein
MGKEWSGIQKCTSFSHLYMIPTNYFLYFTDKIKKQPGSNANQLTETRAFKVRVSSHFI